MQKSFMQMPGSRPDAATLHRRRGMITENARNTAQSYWNRRIEGKSSWRRDGKDTIIKCC